MIHTLETDPRVAGIRQVVMTAGLERAPLAEWTYIAWRIEATRRGPAYWLAHLERAGRRDLPDFPPTVSTERTVAAYINHGRWVWDCPACNAAQVATPEDPRAYCVECFNGGDGWWPVRFPEQERRHAIEDVLGQRPTLNQNWVADEPLDHLQLENLARGLEPGGGPQFALPGAAQALALARGALELEGLPPRPELTP